MRYRLVNLCFHAMGSPCHIQFYIDSKKQHKQLQQLILQRLRQLETRYSRYLPESLVSRINQAAGSGKATSIDPETAALLSYAEQCYLESNGLFDISSGILRRLWSMDKRELPTEQDIAKLLPLIGWEQVQWSRGSIYLPQQGMQLDFGGIVKEYAADSIAEQLRQFGIQSGIVELGGDIRVIGPQPDGSGWPVAIRNPLQPDASLIRLQLRQGALASSGDYQRYQLIAGVRYGHILNPKTGKPVFGLRAVSIISEHCVVAGSIATLAMLSGNNGLSLLQGLELDYFCCTEEGRFYESSTLSQQTNHVI